MKNAVLWGSGFGILQVVITLVFTLNFSSLSTTTVKWVTILTLSLYVTCGLICTVKSKAFGIGIASGFIATGFEVTSGLLIGIFYNPYPRVGLFLGVIFFIIRIALRVLLTGVGASIGYFIYKKRMYPA